MSLGVESHVAAVFSANPYRFVLESNESSSTDENAVHLRLHYLAEGNANIIFFVAKSPKSQPSLELSFLENKLLRIPKFPSGSTRALSAQSMQDFKSGETVNQETVVIEAQLLQRLHDHINHASNRWMRSGRSGSIWDSSLRMNTYVSGLLIEDMRPKSSEGQATLHFKPKWLAQSPNAPSKARRCRTCALQALQGLNRTTYHCPLALATGEVDYVRQQVTGIMNAQMSTFSDQWIHYFTHCLCYGTGHVMIQRLKSLQEQLDLVGVLRTMERGKMSSQAFGQEEINGLAKAMTLRDCSLYVRITPLKNTRKLNGVDDVRFEVRLGDLDEKLPENIDDTEAIQRKLDKWATAERKLIESGYYLGTEELELGQERHKSCFLWNDSAI